ncbi:hypothetical protein TREES_T100017980 [Tupaia chinensis]|uniref:Uncharacterized protein n=1 Tax=Tupaia chinensis TaxID=246437 RepID=L9JUE6_TUPCH|nr:hypothetical protein TREES_T100017980 [Tupaia chinensis]
MGVLTAVGVFTPRRQGEWQVHEGGRVFCFLWDPGCVDRCGLEKALDLYFPVQVGSRALLSLWLSLFLKNIRSQFLGVCANFSRLAGSEELTGVWPGAARLIPLVAPSVLPAGHRERPNGEERAQEGGQLHLPPSQSHSRRSAAPTDRHGDRT